MDITCPTCGTVTYLEELKRDADAFCRGCDYPLFWVRSQMTAPQTDDDGIGLRRLPGTTGQILIAAIYCPACDEPNKVTATICIRCGADLHPKPAEPEPEPEVEPVAEEAPPEPEFVDTGVRWWFWVVVIVLTAFVVYCLWKAKVF
jgi:hypothetical protein